MAAPLLDAPGLTPLQRLACAVLRQAVADATSRTRPPAGRALARAWLRDGDGLRFWCAVAGLPPDLVQARIAAPPAPSA
jgi:hypothetical protein